MKVYNKNKLENKKKCWKAYGLEKQQIWKQMHKV